MKETLPAYSLILIGLFASRTMSTHWPLHVYSFTVIDHLFSRVKETLPAMQFNSLFASLTHGVHPLTTPCLVIAEL